MKWRVMMAAIFVLLLFAAFAWLYVATFVRKHQQAIILFVVDGLDLNTLQLARQQVNRGPAPAELDDPLINDARRRAAYRSDLINLDSFWNLALLRVQEPGRPVPDEGADATALACGARVDNGCVAMNARNEPLKSLIYAAEQAQRATGLVTTSSLVRPTPVAFYSTSKGTPDPYRQAQDLVYSDIGVVLGGGAEYFTPASVVNERGRLDGRDLIDEAQRRGYTLLRTRDELNRLSTWRTRQVLGLFAPGDFYFSGLQPERSTQPSLREMTQAAISCLNHNLNGYFLVVAPGMVARASEQNLGRVATQEVEAVDEAVAAAIEYAGPDALILVTNNYSLGALAQPTGPNAAMWLNGPGGVPAGGQAKPRPDDKELLRPEPAIYFMPHAKPLAGPAWLASRGGDSAQFRGFFENTDLFDLIAEQF